MKLILCIFIAVMFAANIFGEYAIQRFFYPRKPNQPTPEPTPFKKAELDPVPKGAPQKKKGDSSVDTVDTHSTCTLIQEA